MLPSYPKVYNMGHRAIKDLFLGPVVVQEKVDGSQFTFGRRGDALLLRSKGAVIDSPETADKLFRGACATVKRLFDSGLLVDGWSYRAEAMCGPRHNTLQYGRAPEGNLILFDVDTGEEDRLPTAALEEQVARLGIERVPVHYEGVVETLDQLKGLIELPSCLGGQMEGVVVKNYNRFGVDGKMLMGKLVRDDFREKHRAAWGAANPARHDVIGKLQETYRHERRWEKAVEYLRDLGQLEESPRDIGPLIRRVKEDVRAECAEEIAEILFRAFYPEVERGLTTGLPEWYKARLEAAQFADVVLVGWDL